MESACDGAPFAGLASEALAGLAALLPADWPFATLSLDELPLDEMAASVSPSAPAAPAPRA